MKNENFDKVNAIVMELKRITYEMGFTSESLLKVMEMKDKFIEEGKHEEALIVETYMHTHTSDEY